MSFLGSAGATCPVCRSLAQVARLPLGPLLHSPPRLPELLSQPSELLEFLLFLFPDVAITRYHYCRLPLSSTNCYVWLVGLSLVGFWVSVVRTVQGLSIYDGSSSSFSCFCCLHKNVQTLFKFKINHSVFSWICTRKPANSNELSNIQPGLFQKRVDGCQNSLVEVQRAVGHLSK